MKNTELEKRAIEFLDETDTYQFTTYELLTMFVEKENERLRLLSVSRSLKEKHLDTFEEFLLYHCEKQDDYQYIYKGHEYWKNNLHYIYEQLKSNQP